MLSKGRPLNHMAVGPQFTDHNHTKLGLGAEKHNLWQQFKFFDWYKSKIIFL